MQNTCFLKNNIIFALILLKCGFIVGCGSNPITLSNYEKIEVGMSQSEVEAIIGKGKESSSSGGDFAGISMNAKSLVWQHGTQIITVMFMNGEVISKAQANLN